MAATESRPEPRGADARRQFVQMQVPNFLTPQADDSGNPKWLRVALHAYARLDRTGHVEFGPGELSALIPNVNRATGEVTPDRHVNDHIRTAVARGWIGKGSTARCIVVPPWVATSGLGPVGKRCSVHGWVQVGSD